MIRSEGPPIACGAVCRRSTRPPHRHRCRPRRRIRQRRRRPRRRLRRIWRRRRTRWRTCWASRIPPAGRDLSWRGYMAPLVFPQLTALGSQPDGLRGGPGRPGGKVPRGFHQGSTRVPPGFHEVLQGLQGGASTKKSTACCWGYELSLLFFSRGPAKRKEPGKRRGVPKRSSKDAWVVWVPFQFAAEWCGPL